MTSTQQRHDARDLPLRPELVGKSAYGAPQLDVEVRLNTNENPFPPSPAIQKAILDRVARELATANRYPDRDAVELRTSLAAYVTATTGVPLGAEHVWAANGSNEVLQQVLQAFGGPGRTALGFEPTYSMHKLIAEATATAYIAVPRDEDFGVSPDAAAAAVERHKPDVVFLCTPNNPTGTASSEEVIEAVYDAAPGVVIIDEAYVEFASEPSVARLLAGRPRLLISRTMSKAFGFAGARVGYLLAHPEVVSAMKLVRLPYHLSALTQQAAIGALEHHVELLHAVDLLRHERDRVARSIEGLGLVVHPSESNFLLFGTFEDAAASWQQLLDRGVLVRDIGIPGHLRVSIGTPEENDHFLHALKEIA